MKTRFIRKRGGFTLVEITIAMMMGMAVAAMITALFNQQLAFLKMYRAQTFITEEAPIISQNVSRIIGQADRFRLHENVDEALSGSNPRTTASPVVVLNFRQPDGTSRAALLSFENRGAGPALYYRLVPVSGVMGEPQWYITNKASNVVFSVDEGILRMRLTGSAGEQITYSGTMQQ